MIGLAAARAAAKALIRPYVARGDSYDDLEASWMGYGGPDYRAGIGHGGGWGPDCRAKSTDDIIVSRVGEEDCCYHFSLRELYGEIRDGIEQPTLF